MSLAELRFRVIAKRLNLDVEAVRKLWQSFERLCRKEVNLVVVQLSYLEKWDVGPPTPYVTKNVNVEAYRLSRDVTYLAAVRYRARKDSHERTVVLTLRFTPAETSPRVFVEEAARLIHKAVDYMPAAVDLLSLFEHACAIIYGECGKLRARLEDELTDLRAEHRLDALYL